MLIKSIFTASILILLLGSIVTVYGEKAEFSGEGWTFIAPNDWITETDANGEDIVGSPDGSYYISVLKEAGDGEFQFSAEDFQKFLQSEEPLKIFAEDNGPELYNRAITHVNFDNVKKMCIGPDCGWVAAYYGLDNDGNTAMGWIWLGTDDSGDLLEVCALFDINGKYYHDNVESSILDSLQFD